MVSSASSIYSSPQSPSFLCSIRFHPLASLPNPPRIGIRLHRQFLSPGFERELNGEDSLSSMGLDLVEVEDLSTGSTSSARVRLKGICESDLPHTSIPRAQVVDHIYCQLDPIQFSVSTSRPSVLRMKKSKKSKKS